MEKEQKNISKRSTLKSQITDLKSQIAHLNDLLENERKSYDKLQEKYNEIIGKADNEFLQSPEYNRLVRQNETLKKNVEVIESMREKEAKRAKNRELMLQERLDQLSKENEELQRSLNNINETKSHETESKQHNVRGAGRKPNPERTEKLLLQLKQLILTGKKEKDILNEMDISRASYFRYKKMLKSKNYKIF